MNEHTQVSDLLPLYVSGSLDRDRIDEVEKHLAACVECQADLALWDSVAVEITRESQAIAAPRKLVERVIEKNREPKGFSSKTLTRLRRAIQIIRSQAPLVRGEIWPASAAVIAMGYIAAILARDVFVIHALATLIAAACVAVIYGPDHDPTLELALSTPTSPRQILLARLVLVFGYNLGLAAVATLGLLPFIQHGISTAMILGWLAPMTFLSAVALVISLWLGTANALSLTYTAWLAHLFAGPLRAPQTLGTLPSFAMEILSSYQHFWQVPSLLIALALLLFALAFLLAGRQERTFSILA